MIKINNTLFIGLSFQENKFFILYLFNYDVKVYILNVSDGRLTTEGSRCTHTLQEPGAWWVVDIGGPYNVRNVTITKQSGWLWWVN